VIYVLGYRDIQFRMLRLAVVAVLVGLSVAYPTGPPVDQAGLCEHMEPTGHINNNSVMYDVQPQPLPYEMLTSTVGACFNKSRTVTIMFNTTKKDWYFEGFFAQVVKGSDNTKNYGTFEAIAGDDYTAAIKCFNNEKSAIAQKKKAHFWSRKFTWTAPSDLEEDVKLRFTMVKNVRTFWVAQTEPLTYKADCADAATPLPDAQIEPSGSHEDGGDDTSKASSNIVPALLVTMATLLFATLLP